MPNTNSNTVTVIMTPGSARAVFLEDGATVGDAIVAADFSSDGYQIRLDGNAATTTDEVSHGSRVVLSRQIKGN